MGENGDVYNKDVDGENIVPGINLKKNASLY